MSSRIGSIASEVINFIEEVGQLLPLPFESPYAHLKRIRRLPYTNYYNTVRRLQKRGWVNIIEKNGQRFIRLTREGQLYALFNAAKMDIPLRWDEKWRMIIFDIPEFARSQRNLLRKLLKKNNYYGLQDSVYISPYPLNRAAISYLQRVNLMDYIRIVRIDEMDNDKDLKKKFKLK